MIEGLRSLAILNNVLVIRSASPTNLLVILLAEILKKVDSHWAATHFAIIVFPFPGGPNNNKPVAGALKPVNTSGRNAGKIIGSYKANLTDSKPCTSRNDTFGRSSIISDSILSRNAASCFANFGSFFASSSPPPGPPGPPGPPPPNYSKKKHKKEQKYKQLKK